MHDGKKLVDVLNSICNLYFVEITGFGKLVLCFSSYKGGFVMKKISFFIILSLLGLSLISSHLFAATRGIRVIAKTGQSLYLYKNYHALVVGVSNYEKWPKLPNAVNDAKEVASKLKELVTFKRLYMLTI